MPLTLVGQLTPKLTERRILDRTGQKAARQALGVQVLNTDDIVLAHELGGELMQAVFSMVRNFGMRPGDAPARPLAALRALLRARERSLMEFSVRAFSTTCLIRRNHDTEYSFARIWSTVWECNPRALVDSFTARTRASWICRAYGTALRSRGLSTGTIAGTRGD